MHQPRCPPATSQGPITSQSGLSIGEVTLPGFGISATLIIKSWAWSSVLSLLGFSRWASLCTLLNIYTQTFIISLQNINCSHPHPFNSILFIAYFLQFTQTPDPQLYRNIELVYLSSSPWWKSQQLQWYLVPGSICVPSVTRDGILIMSAQLKNFILTHASSNTSWTLQMPQVRFPREQILG